MYWETQHAFSRKKRNEDYDNFNSVIQLLNLCQSSYITYCIALLEQSTAFPEVNAECSMLEFSSLSSKNEREDHSDLLIAMFVY